MILSKFCVTSVGECTIRVDREGLRVDQATAGGGSSSGTEEYKEMVGTFLLQQR